MTKIGFINKIVFKINYRFNKNVFEFRWTNQGFRQWIFRSYNSFPKKSQGTKNINKYSRKYSGCLKIFSNTNLWFVFWLNWQPFLPYNPNKTVFKISRNLRWRVFESYNSFLEKSWEMKNITKMFMEISGTFTILSQYNFRH